MASYLLFGNNNFKRDSIKAEFNHISQVTDIMPTTEFAPISACTMWSEIVCKRAVPDGFHTCFSAIQLMFQQSASLHCMIQWILYSHKSNW